MPEFFSAPAFVLWGAPTSWLEVIAAAIALVMVAAVGWIDDHRPLSARFRIVVHFLAAIILLALPILFMPKTALAGSAANPTTSPKLP